MKWCEQTLNISGMPNDEYLLMVGIIEDEDLKINVEYYKNDGQLLYTLTEWTKPLRMWAAHQELIEEEVKEKFQSKLNKIQTKHERRSYSDWTRYMRSKGIQC